MLPTVADVLAFDVVRHGTPEVVAGGQCTGNLVRWVHVSELVDIAGLLSGGELVLTTGVALPDEPARLASYVTDLAGVGASGLCIELGRRYSGALPDAMVRAAARHELPLVALRREVPFVRVTEAVHSHIIDAQLGELRASERLHQTFTTMSVRGATPDEVVAEVARLAGGPAVLENLAHQVLAAGGGEQGELLAGWEKRSRSVTVADRTGYDAGTGLLVTVVGARDEDWGRLALVRDEPPGPHDVMLVERAATTLALGRLIERDQHNLLRQAHHTLLSGILGHAYTDDELAARAHALGVPLSGRRLVGIAVRAYGDGGAAGLGDQSTLRSVTETVLRAVRKSGAAALTGAVDGRAAGALLAVPPVTEPEAVLVRLAADLRRVVAGRLTIGAGSVVASVGEARRSLLEARQVADVATAFSDDKPYYRLSDLGVRGLVHLLGEDTRVRTYVERQLGPLLAHDARHRDPLLPVLEAYLRCAGNKSATAAATHLSRPALYDRLERIARVLDVRLDDAEQRTSLHVALLALDSARER